MRPGAVLAAPRAARRADRQRSTRRCWTLGSEDAARRPGRSKLAAASTERGFESMQLSALGDVRRVPSLPCGAGRVRAGRTGCAAWGEDVDVSGVPTRAVPSPRAAVNAVRTARGSAVDRGDPIVDRGRSGPLCRTIGDADLSRQRPAATCSGDLAPVDARRAPVLRETPTPPNSARCAGRTSSAAAVFVRTKRHTLRRSLGAPARPRIGAAPVDNVPVSDLHAHA